MLSFHVFCWIWLGARAVAQKQDSPEMLFADHRRLSGVYWAVSALDLLGALDRLDKESILGYVMSCYRAEEGTGVWGGRLVARVGGRTVGRRCAVSPLYFFVCQ